MPGLLSFRSRSKQCDIQSSMLRSLVLHYNCFQTKSTVNLIVVSYQLLQANDHNHKEIVAIKSFNSGELEFPSKRSRCPAVSLTTTTTLTQSLRHVGSHHFLHLRPDSKYDTLLPLKRIMKPNDYGLQMKVYIKDIWKIWPMWQTKYATTIPKNLGVGVNFRQCSEGYFLFGRP